MEPPTRIMAFGFGQDQRNIARERAEPRSAPSPFGFLDILQEQIMAILNSFWDESGKFKDHKVVSFCGVCAAKFRLEKFEEVWNSLLARNQIPYLTMKEVLRTTRKISPSIPAQSVNERIECLKPFARCIFENLELGIVMAVDVEGYNAMTPKAKRPIGGSDDPFYVAFLRGIMEVSRYAQGDNRVALICDDDEKTAELCYRYYRRVRIVNHTAHNALAAITFADDKSFPALQAADMVASLSRLEAYRRFYRRFYDYKPLFDYLADNHGASSIQWRPVFVDKGKFAELSISLEEMTR
jgi:hypothetical protein